MNEKAPVAGLLQSPLTDSNRRPPPYHGTSQATGGNRRQRIRLVFAVSAAGRFAADCHGLQPRGSIRAPSSATGVRTFYLRPARPSRRRSCRIFATRRLVWSPPPLIGASSVNGQLPVRRGRAPRAYALGCARGGRCAG